MKHPPYHLRTNKAVDRLLLVEVLRALDPHGPAFTYYSLAGPFLEDLRVMDHFFPKMKLVSLESNLQTHKRQMFNQFSSRLTLLRSTLIDFLTHEYDPGERDVFWLDYTDFKYPRFEEFQVVLKAVPAGSVVRITLRAEPEIDFEVLESRLAEGDLTEVRQTMEKSFEEEFAKVMPHPAAGTFASLKDFARMVQLMLRRAASAALDTAGSDRDFFPVQATRYDDNTQMLSVTGVVCRRNEIQATRALLAGVRFADFDWNDPKEISIPALTAKECHKLENSLPVPGDQDPGEVLYSLLDYMIDNSAAATKRQLTNYALYHREYPRFVRVAV